MPLHGITIIKTRFNHQIPAYMLLKDKSIIIKKFNAANTKDYENDYKPSKVMVINKPDNKIRFDEFEINIPYLPETKEYASHSLAIKMDAQTPFIIIPLPANEEEKQLNSELSFEMEYETLD